jgi:hypothetical protein
MSPKPIYECYETHLQVLRVLGDNSSSNTLLALNNRGNASCDIGGTRIGLRRLFHSNNEVWNNVRCDLIVSLDQCRKELEQ